MIKTWLVAFSALWLAVSSWGASLQLPSVFSDHMVLQCGRPVPVWGWAAPGASVVVEFAGQVMEAAADGDGEWRVDLEPLAASSDPRVLKVSSTHQSVVTDLEFSDVLVGEVWFCSGQSNMEWRMDKTEDAASDIPEADYPQIRLYRTPPRAAVGPEKKIDAQWEVCSPDTVKAFSGVAYYFGRKLHRDLQVPVGLLQSAWGATLIEPWTPPCGFAGVESLAGTSREVEKTLPSSSYYRRKMGGYLAALRSWVDGAQDAFEAGRYVAAPPGFPADLVLGGGKQKIARNIPTVVYNGMVAAHVPFAVRGIIWYQGEGNHREGMEYVDKTRALLNGWRQLWGAELPFYFVQLAPYDCPGEDPGVLPAFWEAQSRIVETIPKTGMVVITDCSPVDQVHPPNKKIPGTRLALLAEVHEYGLDAVCTGPVFREVEQCGDRLRVLFDEADGLATRDGASPDWFEVAGEGGSFESANAEIDGDAVIVWSEKVKDPVFVRFAWSKVATPNLVNVSGMPAAAFRGGVVEGAELPQ